MNVNIAKVLFLLTVTSLAAAVAALLSNFVRVALESAARKTIQRAFLAGRGRVGVGVG